MRLHAVVMPYSKPEKLPVNGLRLNDFTLHRHNGQSLSPEGSEFFRYRMVKLTSQAGQCDEITLSPHIPNGCYLSTGAHIN
jgi:hypothetical protein